MHSLSKTYAVYSMIEYDWYVTHFLFRLLLWQNYNMILITLSVQARSPSRHHQWPPPPPPHTYQLYWNRFQQYKACRQSGLHKYLTKCKQPQDVSSGYEHGISRTLMKQGMQKLKYYYLLPGHFFRDCTVHNWWCLPKKIDLNASRIQSFFWSLLSQRNV